MPPLPAELAHLVVPEPEPMESVSVRLPADLQQQLTHLSGVIGTPRASVIRALLRLALAGIELDPPTEAPPAPVTIG